MKSVEEESGFAAIPVVSLPDLYGDKLCAALESFKRGEPDWNLAPELHIQNLPAVQWKLRNIGRMPEGKRAQSLEKLEKVITEWLG